MSLTYTTHSRTPEELLAEFISDLRRRLRALDQRLASDRSAEAKSRTACAQRELTDMLEYWTAVEIRRPLRASRVRKRPDGVLRPSSTDHDGD